MVCESEAAGPLAASFWPVSMHPNRKRDMKSIATNANFMPTPTFNWTVRFIQYADRLKVFKDAMFEGEGSKET